MILTFFLNFLNDLLLGAINLLPVQNIPPQWVSALTAVWEYGNDFSYVFPVSTLLFWLLLILSFEAAILLFQIFGWIIRKIPGIS